MNFGTVYTVESLGGSPKEAEGQQYTEYQCYQIKKCEILVYIKKDPLTSETNFFAVGEASLDCCCLNIDFLWPVDPNGNGYTDNPMDAEGGITEGSVEEGRFRFFASFSEVCCEPCAWVTIEYPGALPSIQYNAACKCEKEDGAASQVPFRVSGTYVAGTGAGSTDAALKSACDRAGYELGFCKGCG